MGWNLCGGEAYQHWEQVGLETNLIHLKWFSELSSPLLSHTIHSVSWWLVLRWLESQVMEVYCASTVYWASRKTGGSNSVSPISDALFSSSCQPFSMLWDPEAWEDWCLDFKVSLSSGEVGMERMCPGSWYKSTVWTERDIESHPGRWSAKEWGVPTCSLGTRNVWSRSLRL